VDIKPSKTDEDGWRYGRQFSAAGKERRDAGWARDQSAVNVVRARDWIRVALKVPIGRRRRTTTMSSTEGRLIAAQLHSQSLGAITEDDDDEAISASPVAAGTTETRIAALEAENARLQDTIAQLEADPTTSKRGQHVATQQDTSTQRAASPSDASEDLRATRSDMWNVAAGEVLSAVRRVHPVATGVAAHRAKAEWYNSVSNTPRAVKLAPSSTTDFAFECLAGKRLLKCCIRIAQRPDGSAVVVCRRAGITQPGTGGHNGQIGAREDRRT
jgi:hypothetical protein